MSRTETNTTAVTGLSKTETRARCNRSTDCRCGQQLDLCVRAHCPRCGRSISQP